MQRNHAHGTSQNNEYENAREGDGCKEAWQIQGQECESIDVSLLAILTVFI